MSMRAQWFELHPKISARLDDLLKDVASHKTGNRLEHEARRDERRIFVLLQEHPSKLSRVRFDGRVDQIKRKRGYWPHNSGFFKKTISGTDIDAGEFAIERFFFSNLDSGAGGDEIK
jgi:hypothetical protein